MEAELVLFQYDLSREKFVEDVQGGKVELFSHPILRDYIKVLHRMASEVKGEVDGSFDVSDYKANVIGMLYYKFTPVRAIVEGFVVAPKPYGLSKVAGGPLDLQVYDVNMDKTHNEVLGLTVFCRVYGNYMVLINKWDNAVYSIENDAGFRLMKGFLQNPQRRKAYEIDVAWYGTVFNITF